MKLRIVDVTTSPAVVQIAASAWPGLDATVQSAMLRPFKRRLFFEDIGCAWLVFSGRRLPSPVGIISSSVASSRDNSPLIRPRCITRIRSQDSGFLRAPTKPKESPPSALGQSPNQIINLRLRADIYSARRLIKDEDLRICGQPFASTTFCCPPPLR